MINLQTRKHNTNPFLNFYFCSIIIYLFYFFKLRDILFCYVITKSNIGNRIKKIRKNWLLRKKKKSINLLLICLMKKALKKKEKVFSPVFYLYTLRKKSHHWASFKRN